MFSLHVIIPVLPALFPALFPHCAFKWNHTNTTFFKSKTTGRSQQAQFLSGGNQQKVVLAKWLASNPRILVLDEPTRGIDVSAKAEIYALINNLTAQGMAILLVSSELPEIMGISDRIIVMHDGEITGEFQREEFSEQSIMTCAIGRRKE